MVPRRVGGSEKGWWVQEGFAEKGFTMQGVIAVPNSLPQWV